MHDKVPEGKPAASAPATCIAFRGWPPFSNNVRAEYHDIDDRVLGTPFVAHPNATRITLLSDLDRWL